MDPQHRKYVIIVSILVHVLFLLLWEGAVRLKIITFESSPEVLKENAPIVFDLQPERPREVIETPDDAKVVEQQKKANFLSDKNALARNPETNPQLAEGEAFARGDFKSHDLPSVQGPLGRKQPQPTPLDKKKQPETAAKEKKDIEEKDKEPPDYLTESSATAFIKEYVMKQPKPTNPGVKESLPSVKHENLESRARDMGGLSFNTYDWDFAPYLLALKKRIQRNIFPPQAFTHLGLISGETLLRFKIYPNGELKDLKVLVYKGHKTLMETSYNAVDISAPFPQLPPDFPENYLEVTGKFIYFVRKSNK